MEGDSNTNPAPRKREVLIPRPSWRRNGPPAGPGPATTPALPWAVVAPPPTFAGTTSTSTITSPPSSSSPAPPPPSSSSSTAGDTGGSYSYTAANLTNPTEALGPVAPPSSSPAAAAPAPTMAADADNLLAREKAAKQQVESEYHEILTKKDDEIDALKGEHKDLKQQLAKLRNDLGESERSRSAVQKEANELRTSTKQLKEHNANLTVSHESFKLSDARLQAETQDQKAELIKRAIEIKKLKDTVASSEAMSYALHEQIDKYETSQREEADKARIENEAAKQDLDNITALFASIFHDLGTDLTINDYIEYIRNATEEASSTTTSFEQSSSTQNLEQELHLATNKQARKRHFAAKWKKYFNDDSDQASMESEDYDHNVTFSEFHEGQTLSKSTIKSVETEPIVVEPTTSPAEPQHLAYGPIMHVQTEPIAPETTPTPPAATPQQLTRSSITSVDTQPVIPQPKPAKKTRFTYSRVKSWDFTPVPPPFEILGFSTIMSVHTTPIAQPKTPIKTKYIYHTLTYTEMWDRSAWWFKAIAYLGFALMVSLVSGLVREYSLWLSANDLTRQHVLELTDGHRDSLQPSPLLLSIGNLLGVDFTTLG